MSEFDFRVQLTESIRNNIRVIYPYGPIVFVPKKLEVRASTIPSAGRGVFALEDISVGSIIHDCTTSSRDSDEGLSRVINDLAFRGDVTTYDLEDNLKCHINIGYMVQYEHGSQMALFGVPPTKIYICAIKDIKAGEELSRYYGLDYWLEYQFWENFPHSKFRESNLHADLPSGYVKIDELRSGLEQNMSINFYGKKIGDKYHYFAAYCTVPYYHKDFAEKIRSIHKLTKPGHKIYTFSEPIQITEHGRIRTLFQTKYLEELNNKKNDIEEEFWEKHSDSKYLETRNIVDLPSEYVFTGCVGCTPSKFAIHAKKVDDKYYYLLNTIPNAVSEYSLHFYYPIKPEEIGTIYLDVTKPDNTPYLLHELVNGLHFSVYLNSLEEQKEQALPEKNTELYDKFWAKYPHIKVSEFWSNGIRSGEHCHLVRASDIPPEYIPINFVSRDKKSKETLQMLYCKKVNGKYHYLLDTYTPIEKYRDMCKKEYIQYFELDFMTNIDRFVDVSKPDLTSYALDEDIYQNMKCSEYYDTVRHNKWQTKRTAEQDFWKKFPNCVYQKTHKMTDLPADYVFITELMSNSDLKVKLYGKLDSDGKFHYIILPIETKIEFYEQKFRKLVESSTPATKPDYLPYDESGCVLGIYYFTSYINKCFLEEI